MTALDFVVMIIVLYATSMEFVNTTENVINLLTFEGPILEGQEAIFYCKKNIEANVWNWKKDDRTIEQNKALDYHAQLYEEVDMLKLVIKKVKVEDANYNFKCCIEVNEQEECKKLTFPQILEVPHYTYPTCQLDKNQVAVGEEVTIECCCEIIKPMPSLTWLGVSSVKHITRDQVKCIRHTFKVEQHHQEETKICEMTTNTTNRIQRNCTIGKMQVLYKPEVKIQGDLPFQTDSEVVLICLAQADPADKRYSWSFSQELYNGILKENGMVIHLKFSPGDEGTVITCEVENSIGKGSANLTVHIGTATTAPGATPGQGTLHVNTPESMSEDSTILAIVGVSLLFVSFLIAAALCYFVLLTPTPRHPFDYTGSVIPQPDIYFEPKDNIVGSSASTGQRHVGIQVPGGADSEPVYMEVPGSDKGSQSHYATSRSVYV